MERGRKIEVTPQEKFIPPAEEEQITSAESEVNPNIKPGYLEIMWEARGELPERMQEILEKILSGEEKMDPDEQSWFDKTREKWWMEKFGIDFTHRKSAEKRGGETRARIKQTKNGRMEQLSQSLHALDTGELIKEFNAEERRTIFYDESSDTPYVVDANDNKRTVGAGDIMADYAWGITYVPDGEMPHSTFRRLAKQILVNEARRDIELLYDKELIRQGIPAGSSSIDKNRLEEFYRNQTSNAPMNGIVAERASREFMTRISFNHPDLGFAVERSNALEDSELKYDFKLRKKRRLRGVAVADTEMSAKEYRGYKRRVGIQFTINTVKQKLKKKREEIETTLKELKKRSRTQRQPVDDIVFVHVPMPEIMRQYGRWLRDGKPSGGPEQYFTPEIKKQIFMEATKGFISIEPETLQEIFPEEKSG